MKPRFLILLTVAGGLAIFMAVKASSPPVVTQVASRVVYEEEDNDLKLRQTTLNQRDLAGDDPVEEAELSIRVEVDPTSMKNRLYYYISEVHGYYVETFEIEFYYNPTPDKPLSDEAVPVFTQYVNDYLEAGDTKLGCLEVTPAELSATGGQIGRSENWEAFIVNNGRARLVNPDPLPPIDRVIKCD